MSYPVYLNALNEPAIVYWICKYINNSRYMIYFAKCDKNLFTILEPYFLALSAYNRAINLDSFRAKKLAPDHTEWEQLEIARFWVSHNKNLIQNNYNPRLINQDEAYRLGKIKIALSTTLMSFMTDNATEALRKAASFNENDPNNGSLRSIATGLSTKKSTDEFKLLCAFSDGINKLNEPSSNGNTALHWASLRGNYDFAVILLNQNANPNLKNKNDVTPLHLAATKNTDNLVSILIRNEANPNAKDIKGKTPLHYAGSAGKEACYKYLLSHGASAYILDKEGKFPLLINK